jgi:hypothetical protein
VVFIDLRKAFDTVDTDILLTKLSSFGVFSMELQWFKSYLTGRSQCVTVGKEMSEPLPVTMGVPQGSILGPLLFLLYLNDLPTVTKKCISSMYADDTETEDTCSLKNPIELQISLNEDLSRLKTYFDVNRLSLNIKKCEFMLIGTYQLIRKMPHLNIHIDNQPLRQVSVAKYLGMFIDQNLKWNEHIDSMTKKISSKIGVLRSLRRIVPIDTLKLLYNAIVQPHFDYGDIIFDTANVNDKARLQKLQSRAARLITGSGPRESRNTMFKQLGWLSLQNRTLWHRYIMIYKCRNNMAPTYLTDCFNQNDTHHEHDTRHSGNLRATLSTTEYYHKSFTVSGPTLWNNLPQDIKICNTLNRFKSATYKLLSERVQF